MAKAYACDVCGEVYAGEGEIFSPKTKSDYAGDYTKECGVTLSFYTRKTRYSNTESTVTKDVCFRCQRMLVGKCLEEMEAKDEV